MEVWIGIWMRTVGGQFGRLGAVVVTCCWRHTCRQGVLLRYLSYVVPETHALAFIGTSACICGPLTQARQAPVTGDMAHCGRRWSDCHSSSYWLDPVIVNTGTRCQVNLKLHLFRHL